ncbi:MAG: hypothetical protein HY079_05695 [Elusimicrobia bacterium]|nr:hypothetical protein [Elusimicrobiota bacterium]
MTGWGWTVMKESKVFSDWGAPLLTPVMRARTPYFCPAGKVPPAPVDGMMSQWMSAVLLDWMTPEPSRALTPVIVPTFTKNLESAGLPSASLKNTCTLNAVSGWSTRLLVTVKCASKPSRSSVACCWISSLTTAHTELCAATRAARADNTPPTSSSFLI